MANKLTSLDNVSGPATLPAYNPADIGCGIVHLGLGAFHKAHQAVYTDQAIAETGGNWRITGINLRSTESAERMNSQNGLYTLVERRPDASTGRVIASIASVIPAKTNSDAAMAALVSSDTRIITLTVTEKAYGIDRSTLAVDLNHPSISHDLEFPQKPSSVLGMLCEAFRSRRETDRAPVTVVCCDNLPENGKLLQAGLLDFANRLDPGLADWISSKVAFPSTMVDRITPASTQATFDEAQRLTGCVDLAAVETEPFSQWVIEDQFAGDRPAWEAGGALFVQDVEPYERMKLRMLNGTHSMLAYCGFLAGHRYVKDTMGDPALSYLIDRHMQAAAATLPALPQISFDAYRRQLCERFSNPALAHETCQIAMDGTEKLPQRILAPALETLSAGRDVRPFAFATAAWMRYATGRKENGETYQLRDPREPEINSALNNAVTSSEISGALHALEGLFPRQLAMNETWRVHVDECLAQMLRSGMSATIAREARQSKRKGNPASSAAG